MKGTIIVSLSSQKKVFDFDLKKMPKKQKQATQLALQKKTKQNRT